MRNLKELYRHRTKGDKRHTCFRIAVELGWQSVNRGFHEGQGQFVAFGDGVHTTTKDIESGHPAFLFTHSACWSGEVSKHAEPELTAATRHVREVHTLTHAQTSILKVAKQMVTVRTCLHLLAGS